MIVTRRHVQHYRIRYLAALTTVMCLFATLFIMSADAKWGSPARGSWKTLLDILLWCVVAAGVSSCATLVFVGMSGGEGWREVTKILSDWEAIMKLSPKYFPQNTEEVETLHERMLHRLLMLGRLAMVTIETRNRASTALKEAARAITYEGAELNDLLRIRKKFAREQIAFEKAERRANKAHRLFLRAWDYLVTKTGFLRDLRGMNPDVWRDENCNTLVDFGKFN